MKTLQMIIKNVIIACKMLVSIVNCRVHTLKPWCAWFFEGLGHDRGRDNKIK